MSSGTGTVPATSVWAWEDVLPLEAVATAPAQGRSHARRLLGTCGLGYLSEDTELLVSELVTNAVRASSPGGALFLRLLADRERLVIEVWDQSAGLPCARPVDDESPGGRGLAVVAAIANRWGCERFSADLKVVWCELLLSIARE
jgi:anti-sigma regulatory factor (Ser/Thr protein kinase)